jgi:hypothetical protein
LVYGLKVKVKCLESLLQKYKASYSTSLAQSDLQATAVRESERRRDCLELLFHMLEEQHAHMKDKKATLSMHPHPMCYPDMPHEHALSYMKLGDCALCCQKFPFNDIIVGHCRHVYHPFCFLSHFKVATVCADPSCGAKMPLTWLKSFGVIELNMDLYDQGILSANEAARVACIATRIAAAVSTSPAIGNFIPCVFVFHEAFLPFIHKSCST